MCANRAGEGWGVNPISASKIKKKKIQNVPKRKNMYFGLRFILYFFYLKIMCYKFESIDMHIGITNIR